METFNTLARPVLPSVSMLVCPVRDEALVDLGKMAIRLAQAIERAIELDIDTVEYLARLQEARMIRDHTDGLRRLLTKHRAEHGC